MKNEKMVSRPSGFLGIAAVIALLGLPWLFFNSISLVVFSGLYLFLCLVAIVALVGLTVVNPNESVLFTFFGTYAGTIRENGFYWVNPFYVKRSLSLRARNFESDRMKVNDKLGNPIMISTILVWRVRDTFKALFEVNAYENFVKIQCDAAVRKLAGSYPYDNFDDDMAEITLRSGLAEVNDALEHEVSERLQFAGIEVLEARIGYLAYAEEIAQAMLKRQQASAIVAARLKIVEGAVGMVEHALDQLSAKKVVELDDERRAAMVSNLMVVLCSDKDASPVVNTGTLHH
jgi:regulator of protease activity HflC (stomatin/prohibitin superfamily)